MKPLTTTQAADLQGGSCWQWVCRPAIGPQGAYFACGPVYVCPY